MDRPGSSCSSRCRWKLFGASAANVEVQARQIRRQRGAGVGDELAAWSLASVAMPIRSAVCGSLACSCAVTWSSPTLDRPDGFGLLGLGVEHDATVSDESPASVWQVLDAGLGEAVERVEQDLQVVALSVEGGAEFEERWCEVSSSSTDRANVSTLASVLLDGDRRWCCPRRSPNPSSRNGA